MGVKIIKAITFDPDMTLIDFMKFKRASSDATAEAMVRAGLKMPVEKAKKLLFTNTLLTLRETGFLGRF